MEEKDVVVNIKRYKKITYFQTHTDVEAYIRNMQVHEDQNLCIAMNPSVRVYSNRKGILPQSTIPYFTNESHLKLSLKSKELSDWIINNIDFVNTEFAVKYAFKNTVRLWTKFVINYYLWVIEIVSNSVNLHKPEIISASFKMKRTMSKEYISPAEDLYVQPKEAYLGFLVHSFAQNNNLIFTDISNKRVAFRKIGFSSEIINFLHFLSSLGRYNLEKNIIMTRVKIKRKPVIFLTTPLNNMKKFANKLNKEKNFSLCFLPETVTPTFRGLKFLKYFLRKYSALLTLQHELLREFSKKIRNETDLFCYRGISFASIIADKFNRAIAPYAFGLNIWSIDLNDLITKLDPLLVLSSGNRTDDLITGELCRKKNIPAVFLSHGSFTYPKNEVERIEWGEHGNSFLRAPFQFIALQSPLAEEYLNFFSPAGNTVKTGPLIWGMPVDFGKSSVLFKRMFNRIHNTNKSKIILHAATPKLSNGLRFHIYETIDEYIEDICELANVVERIPDTVLIIKFRPLRELSVEDLKTLVPLSDKVVLSVQESFMDVLGMSDLLVSFSSTTIEEAIQNRIPVLLYGGGGRYQHILAYSIDSDRPIYKSVVYHIKETKDLEYAIRGILSLNIDRNKDKKLFEPYIYPQDSRVSIMDLLLSTKRNQSQRKV